MNTESPNRHIDNFASTLQAAFRQSRIAIAVRFVSDDRLIVNPAWGKLLGYSLAEFQDVRFRSLIHPEDRPRAAKNLQRLLEGSAQSITSTRRMLHKDGHVIWVHSDGFAIRDADGRIQCVFIISQDVTAAKIFEHEVQAQHTLLETTIATMAQGFAIYDEEMRLSRFNEQFSKLFDYPEGFLREGMSVKELFRFRAERGDYGPGNVGQIVARRFAEASRVTERSSEHTLSTGKSYIHHRKSLPNGGCVTTYTEVTEQRLIEEKLRHAQKMEVVAQLTGGVAHDFNNLLAVIQGNAELLRDEAPEGSKLLEMVEAIRRATNRGSELTHRLLAFSRRQVLRPTIVDISEHIRGSQSLLRRALGEAITFDVQTGPGLCFGNIDVNQLDNAVLNICLNARDAMPDGGSLKITVENVNYGSGDPLPSDDIGPGAYVRICVADSGAGMTKEVLDRAIEPFYTTKEIGKGSGLGLSMVDGFVHQSGGAMTITSAENTGTTVSLYLPSPDTSGATESPAPAPKQAIAKGQGQTILLVEDDPEVRVLFTSFLQQLGYQVESASNGTEAFAILERMGRPHLLMSDVVLPGGLSGFDIARRMREMYSDLKVLFVSGYPDSAQKVEHQQAISGDDFELLEKPFRKQQLAERLSRILG
jgi:PAS domain S-box-containing protein